MTPDKWSELSYRTYVLGHILAQLPSDLLSMREARIQTHKLSRLLDKHFAQYKGLKGLEAGLGALAGTSERKRKKAEGKEAQLAGAQAKNVHIQCDKLFKESFRTTNGQKLTKAEYRVWRKQFDRGIHDNARKFVKAFNTRGALFGSVQSYELLRS